MLCRLDLNGNDSIGFVNLFLSMSLLWFEKFQLNRKRPRSDISKRIPFFNINTSFLADSLPWNYNTLFHRLEHGSNAFYQWWCLTHIVSATPLAFSVWFGRHLPLERREPFPIPSSIRVPLSEAPPAAIPLILAGCHICCQLQVWIECLVLLITLPKS